MPAARMGVFLVLITRNHHHDGGSRFQVHVSKRRSWRDPAGVAVVWSLCIVVAYIAMISRGQSGLFSELSAVWINLMLVPIIHLLSATRDGISSGYKSSKRKAS